MINEERAKAVLVKANDLTVRQVNDLLDVNLWAVQSFRADVRIDFDEYGRVMATSLLNPKSPESETVLDGTGRSLPPIPGSRYYGPISKQVYSENYEVSRQIHDAIVHQVREALAVAIEVDGAQQQDRLREIQAKQREARADAIEFGSPEQLGRSQDGVEDPEVKDQ